MWRCPSRSWSPISTGHLSSSRSRSASPASARARRPRKLLEARIGRGAVLEQVVNDALPSRYSEAVTTSEVKPLGQPDIEITKLEDGEELVFTAEVDVRPEITSPTSRRSRSRSTRSRSPTRTSTPSCRPCAPASAPSPASSAPSKNGDFVSIDLSATVDGEDVPEAKTEGLSHEVGSGQLIEGLDDAIVGLKEGETKVFPTTLAAGEHAGEEAQVTVTVSSVKERELPEPDDEFAQLASEFDTIDELKASLKDQVERVKRIQQAEQIRDKALEVLLEQTEVPLPEKIVQAQIDDTVHNAIHQLDHDEDAFAKALEAQGSSREEFDKDNKENAERAVKTQLSWTPSPTSSTSRSARTTSPSAWC